MSTEPSTTRSKQAIISSNRRNFYLIAGVGFLIVGLGSLFFSVRVGIDLVQLAISIFPIVLAIFMLLFINAESTWVFDRPTAQLTHTQSAVFGRKRSAAYKFADIHEVAVESNGRNRQLVVRVEENGALKSLILGVAPAEEQLQKLAAGLRKFLQGENANF
ncbi:MAG: hypothetical protein KF726_23080 [Anaerolineae bacterium]|nr:hypothetical protein [Anaerolineae bacterium]